MSTVAFTAMLLRPGGKDKGADWTFLNLPESASKELPSRGMVSVEGTFNGSPFQATLEPDGKGGHWLKVAPDLQGNSAPGETVEITCSPVTEEPEPLVPSDLKAALDSAPAKAIETWNSITKAARRDYVFWIVSGKKAETRIKRIEVAVSKLSAGSRRPCCFDRSGMYSKSLICPVAEE